MSIVKRDPKYTTVIDNDHASGLLRYLYDHKEANATDLRNVVPTYDRMKRQLKEMEEAGLLTIKEIETPRVEYIYRLTKKGEKIALKFIEIDAILKEP